MARFPSSDRRILAREGRLGLQLFAPLILLLEEEESASEGTPERGKQKMLLISQIALFLWFDHLGYFEKKETTTAL